ncbi:hypothetical protein NFI95_15995 [Acetobacteraceae bacterium KSS8]|uniref:DUF883 domain-containing protein n=1 Tax=Endosaccharibacter trunci TaxID=2812733 RepID=A0ABT1WBZ1_9PROT|nr:hypothetical protein [Acetobacteraceae bacterium KSS8]
MLFCKKATKKAKTVASDTQEQIQTLRAQVEKLLNQKVTPALGDVADKAETAVSTARTVTNAQVENVSEQVRSQPLVAIGIVAVIGYLVGRILR